MQEKMYLPNGTLAGRVATNPNGVARFLELGLQTVYRDAARARWRGFLLEVDSEGGDSLELHLEVPEGSTAVSPFVVENTHRMAADVICAWAESPETKVRAKEYIPDGTVKRCAVDLELDGAYSTSPILRCYAAVGVWPK